MRRLLLVIMIVPMLLGPGYSRCPADKYHVTGKIIDCRFRLPVPGSMVFVFLDSEEHAYGPMVGDGEKEAWTSSADGRFEVTTYFDTFNSPKRDTTGADDCSRVAQALELVVIKSGYYATRKEFSSLKVVQSGRNDKSIMLPEVCIEARRRP